MNRKRILLVSHILPPAVDGGSRVLYKIGEALKEKGHEVIGLCSDCGSSDDFVKESDQKIMRVKSEFLIYRLPVYRKLHKFFRILGIFWSEALVWSKGPVFRLTEFWSVVERLKKAKIDMVIAGPMPTSILIYARMLSKLLGVKLIIVPCFHQNDEDFRRGTLVKILRKADLILTLTRHEKKYLKNNFGISRIAVLGGGVDEKEIIRKEEVVFPKNKNLLFLGNFSAHKRVELLIDAFEKLALKDEGLSLTIAGQKTLYFPNIENRWKKLPRSLRKRVKLLSNGYDTAQRQKMIDRCSLLVLPSVNESFGLVLVEAWARGKPVLGANLEPVEELICGIGGGMLFKKDNLDDLVKKIRMVLDKKAGKKMGIAGLEGVKNCYTWERIGRKVCQKIERL